MIRFYVNLWLFASLCFSTGSASETNNDFLVICFPRSGSQWVQFLLNGLNDTLCGGELFYEHNRYWREPQPDVDKTLQTVTKEDCDGKAFMEIVRNTSISIHKKLHNTTHAPAFGFRFMINHLFRQFDIEKQIVRPFSKQLSDCQARHEEGVLEYIRENNIKIIVLTRKGVVNLCVSYLEARLNRQWGLKGKEKEKAKVEKIDPFALSKCVKEINFWAQTLLSWVHEKKLQYIDITYEDLREDTLKVMTDVNHFLKGPDSHLETVLFKKASAKHVNTLARIPNWDSLMEALEMNKLEQYIDWD
eukprot:m.14684 g.14684  ORF g.14684 m.14684 type:complete len:303 (+) comp5184_c0_seq1:84-992(+)